MKIKINLLITLIFVLSPLFTMAQCAMCRSAVESTMSNGRNLSAIGLNTGILYLFVAPYLLVTIVGLLWYRHSKQLLKNKIILQNQLKDAFNK